MNCNGTIGKVDGDKTKQDERQKKNNFKNG